MINSMTGYGRHKELVGNLDITVEIKSVNNRYFDCSVKLPRAYSFAEEAIKSRVQSRVSRGKVDVYVTIDSSGANQVKISLNKPVLEGYLAAMKEISDSYGLKNDISVSSMSRFSDIFLVDKAEEDLAELNNDICSVLDKALEGYLRMRSREGRALAEDIVARIGLIERLIESIEERSPVTVAEYRGRLLNRLNEVLEKTGIDESRILTEAAIFADKTAVDEETVRLKSHLLQLRDMLRTGGIIGRKLDFLIQELNREANTIGSKNNDLEQTRYVVDLKAQIEKIREQVQNIE